MILSINLNLAIDKVLILDEFKLKKENRVKVVSSLPGGKGVNVARCLRSFNRLVTVTGFKGGFNGEFIEKGLIKEHIYPLLFEIEEENRICNIILDKKGNIIQIYEVGPRIKREDGEGFLNFLKSKIDSFNYIVISGSLPIGLEKDFIFNLIDTVKGKKIFLDIKGDFLINFLEKSEIFFLKINEDEFCSTFNIKGDNFLNDLLKIKNKYKIKSLSVTLGEKGAIFVLNGKIYKLYSNYKIDVLNPVGAGDSFMGGYLFGITEGMSFLDSAKYGLASSISNVTLYEGGRVNFDIFYDILKNCVIEEV